MLRVPFAALIAGLLAQPGFAAEPTRVKVFVASMFEIGNNTGDRAGEFQHWYERYWLDATPIATRGALNPVYCNTDGVCGAVLGMGKVASSSSMQAERKLGHGERSLRTQPVPQCQVVN